MTPLIHPATSNPRRKKNSRRLQYHQTSPSHITPLSRTHPPSPPLSHTHPPIHRFLSLNSQTDSGSGFDTFLSTHTFLYSSSYSSSSSRSRHPRSRSIASPCIHSIICHPPHSAFACRVCKSTPLRTTISYILHPLPLHSRTSFVSIATEWTVSAYRPRHRPITVNTHRPPD